MSNIIIRYVQEDEVEEVIEVIQEELGLLAEEISDGEFV